MNNSDSKKTVLGPPVLRLLGMKQVQPLVGGKSRSTIFRWISEGSFPKGVKFRGSRMWTEDSIAAWQQEIINK